MMTEKQIQDLPAEQRAGLMGLYKRAGLRWDDFVERCSAPTLLSPYIGVRGVCGSAFTGIEPDGYTHT